MNTENILYACMHPSIHTYIHKGLRPFNPLQNHIHACMHTYIHTYIHTYMHACIHTYMFRHTRHSHAWNRCKWARERYHLFYWWVWRRLNLFLGGRVTDFDVVTNDFIKTSVNQHCFEASNKCICWEVDIHPTIWTSHVQRTILALIIQLGTSIKLKIIGSYWKYCIRNVAG